MTCSFWGRKCHLMLKTQLTPFETRKQVQVACSLKNWNSFSSAIILVHGDHFSFINRRINSYFTLQSFWYWRHGQNWSDILQNLPPTVCFDVSISCPLQASDWGGKVHLYVFLITKIYTIDPPPLVIWLLPGFFGLVPLRPEQTTVPWRLISSWTTPASYKTVVNEHCGWDLSIHLSISEHYSRFFAFLRRDLIPEHMWKSKIGPLEGEWDKNQESTFF